MEPEIDEIINETKIEFIIEIGWEYGLDDAAIIERLQKKQGYHTKMQKHIYLYMVNIL